MATQQTKRNSVIRTQVIRNADGMAVGVRFLDSADRDFYTVELDRLTPEIFAEAAAHGIKQKGADSAAMSRNPETGKSATAQEKLAAVCVTLDRVCNEGQWNATREGGEGSGSMLARALVRYHNGTKTMEQVKAWLETKSDPEKKALRANKKIAAIIAEIMAEQAPDDVDSDELIAELDDME